MLTFFGLASNHSIQLHSQIFDMCNYGNGFTMMEVYNMPTHLRRFYYNKLVDTKNKENKEVEKQSNAAKSNSKVRVR